MLKGSCLCKAVTYTLDEELSELVFCHCSFCRKATASAYTVNAKVSSKNLVFLIELLFMEALTIFLEQAQFKILKLEKASETGKMQMLFVPGEKLI